MAKEVRRSSMENKPTPLSIIPYFPTRLRISLVSHSLAHNSKVDDFSSRAPAPNYTQTQ